MRPNARSSSTMSRHFFGRPLLQPLLGSLMLLCCTLSSQAFAQAPELKSIYGEGTLQEELPYFVKAKGEDSSGNSKPSSGGEIPIDLSSSSRRQSTKTSCKNGTCVTRQCTKGTCSRTTCKDGDCKTVNITPCKGKGCDDHGMCEEGGEPDATGECGGGDNNEGGGMGAGDSTSQGGDHNKGPGTRQGGSPKSPSQKGAPPEPPPELDDPLEPLSTPDKEEGQFIPLLILLGVIALLLGVVYLFVKKSAPPSSFGTASSMEDVDLSNDELINALEEETQGRGHQEWAGEMQYDTAIHALLLSALRALLAQRKTLGIVSLTSREILARAELLDEAKAHLRTLVIGAELSMFAQKPADKARYDTCSEAFSLFMRALGHQVTSQEHQEKQA